MTYEYVCGACGHQWEAEQSIKDQPLKKCESCKKNHAKRLVSGGTGFLLKGGGWYADGYGSGGKASKSDASPSKKETGGDAKPSADAGGSKSSSSDGASSGDGAGSSKGTAAKSNGSKNAKAS